MTTRRRAALTAVTVAAFTAGAAALTLPTASAEPAESRATLDRAVFAGPLVDLAPTVSGPFDGATAVLRMRTDQLGSTFHLLVKDVGAAGRGQTFGAHLHVGPCVAGDPAAALGHYNTDAIAGITPVVSSPATEVWLDVTVDAYGTGASVAHVPFVPAAGNRSVVIHAESTDPATGKAGGRQACLPVSW